MARPGAGNAYRGHENVGPLRHGAGISHQAVEALFSAPPAPSKGFHGARSMMCFESFNMNAAGEVGQYPAHNQYEMDDMLDDDADEYGAQRAEKKRRLTTDQVQFLEKSFEVENKLEPERKVQLAKDLGLQPRQVAIWFQNRRARWKTKQIEKDYEALQLSFSTLKNDHDHLLREKEELKAEVQALKGKLLLQEKGDIGNNSSNSASSGLIAVPALPLSPPLQLPPLPGKPDDLFSANSAILDYESPRHAEEAWHSDLSQPEEDEGERMEGRSSGYGEFGSSDLWFWPYH